MRYTIKAQIYVGEESGFVAECLDLPVVTQGQTLDECCTKFARSYRVAFGG